MVGWKSLLLSTIRMTLWRLASVWPNTIVKLNISNHQMQSKSWKYKFISLNDKELEETDLKLVERKSDNRNARVQTLKYWRIQTEQSSSKLFKSIGEDVKQSLNGLSGDLLERISTLEFPLLFFGQAYRKWLLSEKLSAWNSFHEIRLERISGVENGRCSSS